MIEYKEGEREIIESHFCDRLCNDVYMLLKLQFPNIKNLEVGMGEEGIVNVIFEETEYTQEQVHDYLQEVRNKTLKK